MTGYPRPARPFWVYPIFGLYLLLLAAVLFSPLAVILSDGGFLPALVLSGGVLLSFGLGASLIAIPVGNLGALPHRQSSIAFPLIGSGICVALLAGAGAFAVDEWLHGTKSPLNGWEFGAVAGATWLLWTVFFYLVSRSLDRGNVERPRVPSLARRQRLGIASRHPDALGRAPADGMLRRHDDRPRNRRRHHRHAHRAGPGRVLPLPPPLPPSLRPTRLQTW